MQHKHDASSFVNHRKQTGKKKNVFPEICQNCRRIIHTKLSVCIYEVWHASSPQVVPGNIEVAQTFNSF